METTQTIGRCKDCTFWSQWDTLPHHVQQGECRRLTRGEPPERPDFCRICGYNYDLFSCGPDFGCVHFEAKEPA